MTVVGSAFEKRTTASSSLTTRIKPPVFLFSWFRISSSSGEVMRLYIVRFTSMVR